MNAAAARPYFLLTLIWLGDVAFCFAQTPDPQTAATNAPIIELPPLVVEEAASGPEWLYANVGGTEYLSRCSATTTRLYIEAWERGVQLMHLLVPADLLPQSDVPAVTILYSQKLKQTTSAEILRGLKQQRSGPADPNDVATGLPRYSFAPNMRLNDRDFYATFAYVDENTFDSAHLTVAPEYVRFLLERRMPALPAWFIDGADTVFRGADLTDRPILLQPATWISWGESRELVLDPDRPRALLPAVELFAPDALRGANGNPRRVETMQAQTALFVRWALVTSPQTRAALWQFVARAATAPATEEMFEACFGFGFSELRDRLSDALVTALRETPQIEPGKLPALPRVRVRTATATEIARLRGEWERLTIGFMQRYQPQLRDRYVEQARKTLRKAYAAGDRDPRLLATMGLCELAAGDATSAREFLEPAVAAGVVRPRAYYEVARIRFADLRRDRSADELFSATELTPVLEPLRRALRQHPPLPEAFALFAEAWVRSREAPMAADLALLADGARLFARRLEVNFPIALALARHGKKAEAVAVLDAGVDYVADEGARTRFLQLRATLSPAH